MAELFEEQKFDVQSFTKREGATRYLSFDIGVKNMGCAIIDVHPTMEPVIQRLDWRPLPINGKPTSTSIINAVQFYLDIVTAPLNLDAVASIDDLGKDYDDSAITDFAAMMSDSLPRPHELAITPGIILIEQQYMGGGGGGAGGGRGGGGGAGGGRGGGGGTNYHAQTAQVAIHTMLKCRYPKALIKIVGAAARKSGDKERAAYLGKMITTYYSPRWYAYQAMMFKSKEDAQHVSDAITQIIDDVDFHGMDQIKDALASATLSTSGQIGGGRGGQRGEPGKGTDAGIPRKATTRNLKK